MKNMNDLITVKKAAQIQGVSTDAIYWALENGKLKETRCGATRLIRLKDAVNYKRGKRGRPRKAKK